MGTPCLVSERLDVYIWFGLAGRIGHGTVRGTADRGNDFTCQRPSDSSEKTEAATNRSVKGTVAIGGRRGYLAIQKWSDGNFLVLQ